MPSYSTWQASVKHSQDLTHHEHLWKCLNIIKNKQKDDEKTVKKKKSSMNKDSVVSMEESAALKYQTL